MAAAKPKKELTRNQAIQFYALSLTFLCFAFKTGSIFFGLSQMLTGIFYLHTATGTKGFLWGLAGMPAALALTAGLSHLHL